jgi:hypothetical protein
MPQGKLKWKILKQIRFRNLNWKFLFLNFQKKWSYHQREMENFGKKINFEFWKKIGHTTSGKWKKLKYAMEIWNEKNWKFSFLNFEMIFCIFEIWNENFCLKFEKKWPYHQREMKIIWNEEITYFVYATEIKLPIIPLYHLCIPPYITGASCGGIQLISAVRSFRTGHFPVMI